MSSYLTIYGRLKGTNKYIGISCHSRSTDIYQTFYENINPVWAGEEEKYTKLTTKDIDNMINSIKDDISKAEERINEYEKHAGGNEEIIADIIEFKHYVNDLRELIGQMWQVYYIVQNAEMLKDCEDRAVFDGIYCNVD